MLRSDLALGAFVRSMRERAAPPAPALGRRRTRGLRREELSTACGISVTWLTWIEQGRTVAVSAATLARLAQALRLSVAERRYLFTLAGRHDPDPPIAQPSDLPAPLLACLRAISAPAYVLDRLCEARAWNEPAAALFTGWLDRTDKVGGHNLLRFLFQNPDAQTLVSDWPERSRRVVAEFRADHAARLDDPQAGHLIAALSADSPAFRSAWEAHEVAEREGGRRLFSSGHGAEPMSLQQQPFAAIAWPGLKLVILTALDADATSVTTNA